MDKQRLWWPLRIHINHVPFDLTSSVPAYVSHHNRLSQYGHQNTTLCVHANFSTTMNTGFYPFRTLSVTKKSEMQTISPTHFNRLFLWSYFCARK